MRQSPVGLYRVCARASLLVPVGGGSDSSAHKREKLWGGSGLHLGTTGESLWLCSLSWLWDMWLTWGQLHQLVVLPRVLVMVISLQRWGPLGPSLPHLALLGPEDCHSELWGQGTHVVPALLCRALLVESQTGQHIFVEPWPKPLSLLPTPLNNPKLPWNLLGEGNPFAPATPDSAGWSMSPLVPLMWPAAWRLWLAGRPFFGPGHCQNFHSGKKMSDQNSLHHSGTPSFSLR